jgi:aspartate dehydrogenase
MKKRIKIGIIGCGTIGSELARAIETDFKDKAKVVGLCDLIEEKALNLAKSLKSKPSIVSIEKLIISSDLVIEAASAGVSAGIVEKTLSAGKDIMVMSVGGLLGHTEIFDLAKKKMSHLYLPSGAICGLDGVKSAALGRLDKVMLITRKPPRSLEGAPYLVKKGIDLNQIKEETLLFEGTAEEAIKGFPQNVNVSATLSIAGIGPEKTRVKIITSPFYTSNIHEVEAEGAFGRLTVRTENIPSLENPKTSYLAILSSLATLKQILEPVKIGT